MTPPYRPAESACGTAHQLETSNLANSTAQCRSPQSTPYTAFESATVRCRELRDAHRCLPPFETWLQRVRSFIDFWDRKALCTSRTLPCAKQRYCEQLPASLSTPFCLGAQPAVPHGSMGILRRSRWLHGPTPYVAHSGAPTPLEQACRMRICNAALPILALVPFLDVADHLIICILPPFSSSNQVLSMSLQAAHCVNPARRHKSLRTMRLQLNWIGRTCFCGAWQLSIPDPIGKR